LEFMASGVPVIATDVGGVPELIQDELTGLLVKPESPTDLAAKISFAMRNPQRINGMTSSAIHWVRNNYSMAQMVENYNYFYSQILGIAE
jgi:glycosyltransferase involved in cell wall biosynthesis